MTSLSRRSILAATLLAPWTLDLRTLDGWKGTGNRAQGTGTRDQGQGIRDEFPAQDPKLVQEIVGASHSNLARVKELVTRQPSLAKAAWDWGFGDWETALGAASHVGQRAIAQLLLEHGAPPTIYSAAMLGHLDTVKAFIAADPAAHRRRGPHSIPLLSHALAGGPEAAGVVAYLKALGGADERLPVVPLSPDDQARIVGTYRFGESDRDVLTMEVSREILGLTRPGASRRNIFCLNADATGWVFYPVGAEAVRIKAHRAGDRVETLTIADPEIVVTARRV